MKKIIIALLVVFVAIVPAVLLSVRNINKAGKAKEERAPEPKAHVVSEKDKARIIQGARQAVALLQTVRDDTGALSSFLANPLLEQTAKDIQTESQAGRVKIRNLKDVTLVLKNFTQGIAGVTLTYTDESYYIDKKTGRPLGRPTRAKETRALAMRRVNGKWKIYSILSGLKPEYSDLMKKKKKTD